LLRSLAKQDIQSGRGFVYFDLHGDAIPFLLETIALEERATQKDLSDKLIVERFVQIGDPGWRPRARGNGDQRSSDARDF
jgi:hypothetical protein